MAMRGWGGTAGATLLLLTGCGSDPDAGTGVDQLPSETTTEAEETSATTSACQIVFADAAAVDSGQDTHESLWPAFTACVDLAEFAEASEAHPDALGGTDPETYVTNQCASEPEVADTPVCADVNGP